jgi:hypothetical protein
MLEGSKIEIKGRGAWLDQRSHSVPGIYIIFTKTENQLNELIRRIPDQ